MRSQYSLSTRPSPGLRDLMRVVAVTVLAATSAAIAPSAIGQAYPTKVVRFIVPFAPGGQSDAVARIVGQKLAERWGQPVVIENKPGAATTIGSDLVAKS